MKERGQASLVSRNKRNMEKSLKLCYNIGIKEPIHAGRQDLEAENPKV